MLDRTPTKGWSKGGSVKYRGVKRIGTTRNERRKVFLYQYHGGSVPITSDTFTVRVSFVIDIIITTIIINTVITFG